MVVSLQSLKAGKWGGRFSKKLVMPSMKSGRSIDSCISFSATALASNTSRMVSAYTCCLIIAREFGAQFAAMSSAKAIARGNSSSGGDDLLHQSEGRRLVGVEHPTGQQQVKRGAGADHPRKYPRDA